MKDELVALLDEILPLARFNVAGFGRVIGIEEYRLGYAQSQTYVKGVPPSWFIHAEVEVDRVPEVKFNRLVETIKSALGPFFDPTRSRVAFLTLHILGQGMYPEPDIDRFTRQTIRCAALSGSDRTVDLLLGWVNGASICYTEMMVLQGIHQEQDRLDFQPGVRLIQLSRDGSRLFDMIPEELALKLGTGTLRDGSWSIPLEGLPGATVLCVDVTASPVLYKPDDATSDIPGVNRHSSLKYPPHLVLQALSLAFDSHVGMLRYWRSFDAEITMLTGGFNRPYSSPPRRPPWNAESAALTQGGVDRARDLSEKLARQSGGELQVAIQRWMKSKPLSEFADDSIDIRIALEALFYQEGESTELSLRLALRGAWYLGNDESERIKYFRTIKEAYRMCSKAVHTGSLKGEPSSIRELLSDTQNICRKTLLKRLDEGKAPDWDTLILGSGIA